VLVVDDDEVIRHLIAVNLTLEGFDVATAVDGQDCLDKVSAIDPDVITLDVMMPRLDGWVTASMLRRNPETSGIKVVLITARAQEDDKARGRQIGVDAYLTKPFDPSEMIRVVRELAGHAPDGESVELGLTRGGARNGRGARGAGHGLRETTPPSHPRPTVMASHPRRSPVRRRPRRTWNGGPGRTPRSKRWDGRQ
jgi:DNA-binding response OmpR family regulator